MLSYGTAALENMIPADEYIRGYVDVPRFLECCRACPNYTVKWSCPPYDFDPLALWRGFREFWIFGTKLTFGAEAGSGWDVWDKGGGVHAVLAAEKTKLLDRALSLEKEYPGGLALSAGSCEICGANCTKRFGSPCRRPDRMRYSIESLGGNVCDTAEKLLGTPIKWASDGKLPEYLVLVCGILLK